MNNTSIERIQEIHRRQKAFFRSGASLPVCFRKQQLRALQTALKKWEDKLAEALWKDMHKSYEEAFLTEFSIVLAEIKTHLSKLDKWAKDECVPTPVKLFPGSSRIVKEPLGNALIIAPWNYPVQLILNPLVGAISAGCTAVLKPSPYVPEVSRVLSEMIADTFPEEYVATVQGNRDTNTALLDLRWDIIFFTGSPSLGKTVMAAAARNLCPVILELGGKSPCIVDKDADISLAARRIAWGKSLNAGQTCIAPDYLMLHEDIKEEFLKELKLAFQNLLGEDAQKSAHYVRIVSDKAFERLCSYLSDSEIVFGGRHNAAERFIEPTVLDNISPDSAVMQEEIFGPIFPVQVFKEKEELLDFINSREKPLALYYFGKSGKEIIRRTSAGGSCINDVIMHIANEKLPFGGVGNSGLGCYHNKLSFDAFTHRRAVLKTGCWADTPFRYMPYKWFKLAKRFL